MFEEKIPELNGTIKSYKEILEYKKMKLNELQDAVNSETTLKLKLLHKSNEVRLHPSKVKEELELDKLPTEKQIQAHIDEKYSDLTDEYELAKQNTSLIRRELEFIDDCLSLEKYIVRELEVS